MFSEVFRCMKKEVHVSGKLRVLFNEELRGLYGSPSIVRLVKCRRLRWAGHVARNLYITTVRNPFGRLRGTWEDNIKMSLG
jgi:hypothetical protein